MSYNSSWHINNHGFIKFILNEKNDQNLVPKLVMQNMKAVKKNIASNLNLWEPLQGQYKRDYKLLDSNILGITLLSLNS